LVLENNKALLLGFIAQRKVLSLMFSSRQKKGMEESIVKIKRNKIMLMFNIRSH